MEQQDALAMRPNARRTRHGAKGDVVLVVLGPQPETKHGKEHDPPDDEGHRGRCPHDLPSIAVTPLRPRPRSTAHFRIRIRNRTGPSRPPKRGALQTVPCWVMNRSS